MPSVNAVQQSSVQAAIQRASAATGVDFKYLMAQAKLESGLDPAARAATSSAAGLFQFVGGTWMETVERHGADHGLGWAEQAITRNNGRASVADPAMRAQVLALRNDPDAASLMAAELARDNTAELQGFLGRMPDPTELYLAHFMGAGGARDFLGALQNDPAQAAAALFPQAAGANRPIFYDNGRARSVGEVMDLMRTKVSGAMDGALPTGMSAAASPDWRRFAPPPEYSRASREFDEAAGPRRPSMAETLQATFGAGGAIGDRATARVNDAYGKFRAFGL